MSKGQLAVLLFMAAWAALVTAVALSAVAGGLYGPWEDALTVGASVLIASFPLAFAAAIWVWLRTKESTTIKYVRLLVVPWILGLLAGAAVLVAAGGNEPGQRDAGAAESPEERAARLVAFLTKGVELDSTIPDSSSIKLVSLSWSVSGGQPSVRAVLQNVSEESIRLTGFTVRYLSSDGDVVGDSECTVRTDPVFPEGCGFVPTLMEAGYAADFTRIFPGGPSIARRDTAIVTVRYRRAFP